KKKKKKSKGIALIAVVAMVVCVAVTPIIHASVSRLYIQSQINSKGEAVFLEVTRKNITEKITITDISYLTDKQATNAITVIAGTTTRLEKYAVEDVDISAGRFTIWKSAVKALNLKGHSSTEEFPVPGRQKIKTTNDPHNAFLSIGFKTGYVGLIAVLFVAVIVAIRCIVIIAGAIKKKELSYKEAITLSFGYSYLLIGMLAGSYLPISEVVAAMFWLTIPVSQRKEKEV
ncbi:MAG: hypothetical protein HUJ78_02345, partial [Mogibacterium sp.]|nr:hypothetical protein [Mogibacterium sp.]